MEHPEMVKVKTWSCYSGTEKQVKVKRRGATLKCFKCGYKAKQQAGGGQWRLGAIGRRVAANLNTSSANF